MTDVAAVVVNHHGASQLEGCVASLLDQTHTLRRVVVVDNDSRDGSAALVGRLRRRSGGRVRLVANPVNRGFAGGANDGIAATEAEVVVVANHDVRARPGYVTAAVGALEDDGDRGAVQGKLLRPRPAPDGRPVFDTTGHRAFTTRLFRNRGEGEVDAGQHDRPGAVFGVSGALAVYRRAMLEDVALPRPDGGREVFDEDLFAFFEDVDLDWRAALRGWDCHYVPAAVARHQRGGAGPRRTPLVERLNWRNRLLTVLKNDDAAALARALPGVAVTTALKTGELAATVPTALAGGLADLRLLRAALRRRRLVGAGARVPRREVVRRWFEPFDSGRWVRMWWRRTRGAWPPAPPPPGGVGDAGPPQG